MPFLKKWVRTKHAILFRLSNRTVQVLFMDRRYVQYVCSVRMLYFDVLLMFQLFLNFFCNQVLSSLHAYSDFFSYFTFCICSSWSCISFLFLFGWLAPLSSLLISDWLTSLPCIHSIDHLFSLLLPNTHTHSPSPPSSPTLFISSHGTLSHPFILFFFFFLRIAVRFFWHPKHVWWRTWANWTYVRNTP